MPADPATQDASTSPDPVALLARSPNRLVRAVTVTVSETEVTLTGVLPTFYLKQLAQETVRPALDGRLLVNRITVAALSLMAAAKS
jgi:hypothetical protein